MQQNYVLIPTVLYLVNHKISQQQHSCLKWSIAAVTETAWNQDGTSLHDNIERLRVKSLKEFKVYCMRLW